MTSVQSGRAVLWLLLAVFVLFDVLLVVDVTSGGSVYAMLRCFGHSSQVVKSVRSPNGRFDAYVQTERIGNGSSQTMYVEWPGKRKFLCLGQLAPKFDCIEQIKWAPDSGVVVFYSKYWLSICSTRTGHVQRIYLGYEWSRDRPVRGSKFAPSGRAIPDIIRFPRPGAFEYRLIGEQESHTLEL